MKVFKFGGASVKDALSVKNIYNILNEYSRDEKLVIVISAMGKTTNALEKVAQDYFDGKNKDLLLSIGEVKKYHLNVVSDLFESEVNDIVVDLESVFIELENLVNYKHSLNYNYEYDQIVCLGEVLSTKIVSSYLNLKGFKNTWVDIREILKTDESYRNAQVNWELSEKMVKEEINFNNSNVYIVQGFIGSTTNNLSTTLGREGSDYTAAIMANILDAESVTIWKDVPGVLNADPKHFNDTVLIPRLSYSDAIDLTYYGTSVIHPKTIKPLQNKKIPLYVKSFLHPAEPGTVVEEATIKLSVPSYILKNDQVLMEISTKDFSFLNEGMLQKIFKIFSKYNLQIALMQLTPIAFKACVNADWTKIKPVEQTLLSEFYVKISQDLQLITIYSYAQDSLQKLVADKPILIKQQTENAIQVLLKV
jgi:aspartate kinase